MTVVMPFIYNYSIAGYWLAGTLCRRDLSVRRDFINQGMTDDTPLTESLLNLMVVLSGQRTECDWEKASALIRGLVSSGFELEGGLPEQPEAADLEARYAELSNGSGEDIQALADRLVAKRLQALSGLRVQLTAQIDRLQESIALQEQHAESADGTKINEGAAPSGGGGDGGEDDANVDKEEANRRASADGRTRLAAPVENVPESMGIDESWEEIARVRPMCPFRSIPHHPPLPRPPLFHSPLQPPPPRPTA